MNKLIFSIVFAWLSVLIYSCEPTATLTSWKNPEVNTQVAKVVVMPLYEKLEYLKPFEESTVATFKSKGLPAIGSLEFLNPGKTYPIDDIKRKCDSVGANAILLFLYQGTDKTESYVPPTTYYSTGYAGYGGYWGGGYWGGYYGGTVTTTGGYWTTDRVVNLTAKLYVHGTRDPLWTSDIKVPNPEYIDQVAVAIARDIYSDWKKHNLIKGVKPEK